MLEHQLWLNGLKLKKWQNVEVRQQNGEEHYQAKWKCQIYRKITQQIRQAIQINPKKRDVKAEVKQQTPTYFQFPKISNPDS